NLATRERGSPCRYDRGTAAARIRVFLHAFGSSGCARFGCKTPAPGRDARPLRTPDSGEILPRRRPETRGIAAGGTVNPRSVSKARWAALPGTAPGARLRLSYTSALCL